MRFRPAPITLLGLLLACAAPAATPPVQDICLGNGTPGPFTLSWKHIAPGTETVRINGLPQMRGLDYALDTERGTIMFTRALPARSAVEVSYERDSGQAQRNGGGQTIPLSVDLLRGEHGYFSLNALGKPGDEGQSDLTLGVGMGWRGDSHSQLSTRVYFAPVTAASNGVDSAPTDRTGLSVAGSAGAGQWALFSFGFSRAGVGLGDTGDDSIRAGQQRLTLSSRLTPLRQVQAVFDYTQAHATGDSPEAAARTSLALTYTPTDRTQMNATVADATGTGGNIETVGLSVATKPSSQMQISASYDAKDAPGSEGDSQAINLKTVLTPARSLSLQTSAAQTRSGAATTDQQAVSLSLSPRSALQINAGLALRQKEAPGQDPLGTTVATVGGMLRPVSFLELSGSYKNRMAPDTDTDLNDQFDTSAAKVALMPLKSVRLFGTYAQNPDDGGDTLQRLAKKGVGLETSLGALGLSGGYDWSRRYDAPDVEETVHADLGLRFSAATRLTVGFQTRQNALDPSTPLATAYTVGFTHSLGERFNLSLNGKRQQTADAQIDYDASANLGMKF